MSAIQRGLSTILIIVTFAQIAHIGECNPVEQLYSPYTIKLIKEFTDLARQETQIDDIAAKLHVPFISESKLLTIETKYNEVKASLPNRSQQDFSGLPAQKKGEYIKLQQDTKLKLKKMNSILRKLISNKIMLLQTASLAGADVVELVKSFCRIIEQETPVREDETKIREELINAAGRLPEIHQHAFKDAIAMVKLSERSLTENILSIQKIGTLGQEQTELPKRSGQKAQGTTAVLGQPFLAQGAKAVLGKSIPNSSLRPTTWENQAGTWRDPAATWQDQAAAKPIIGAQPLPEKQPNLATLPMPAARPILGAQPMQGGQTMPGAWFDPAGAQPMQGGQTMPEKNWYDPAAKYSTPPPAAAASPAGAQPMHGAPPLQAPPPIAAPPTIPRNPYIGRGYNQPRIPKPQENTYIGRGYNRPRIPKPQGSFQFDWKF